MASLPFVRHALASALSISLCALPLPVLAQDADPASMTEEQRLGGAKQLYAEGDAAMAAEDPALALVKFEQAYNDYAPDLHVFNVNIGVAAHQVGDCIKAKAALQRFLDMVPKHPARKSAQQELLEIERSGCVEAQQAAIEEEQRRQAEQNRVEPSREGDNFDAPDLDRKTPGSDDLPPDEEPTEGGGRGKLIAGAVLTGLGGAALIGGAISLGIANRRANELATLSSPGPTGFSPGDYSDEEVSGLDRRGLPAANAASVGLFVGGGVLAAVGVTLIVLDRTGKNKAGDPNARRSSPRLTGLGPALLRGGGGASATLRF